MIFFHEILHIHKRNHKEQYLPSRFSIFLKVMEFRWDVFKMFISTIWYDNVDDYDFFEVEKCSSIENLLGLNIILIIWQK